MKNIQLVIGLVLFVILIIIALAGPYLPFIDSGLTKKILERYDDGSFSVPPFAPNDKHIIGTDREGRDLLSRIIIGAKETVFYLLFIVILRYTLALPLGLLSFFFKGFHLLLLTFNQFFSRLPTIIVTVIIINIPFFIFSSERVLWMIILIAFVEVGRVGDIVYNHMKSNSHNAYIENGIVTGISTFRLIKQYYFPFLMPQVIINFVLDLGRTMLLLGQLGLFSIFIAQEWLMTERAIVELQLTSHAWPLLLKDVIRDIRIYPWIPFWATFAITYVTVTFNLLGDGIRKYYMRRYSI